MIQSQYEPENYDGDDVEDTFDFTWKILAAEHLVVKVVTLATGDEETLELDTDYTVPEAGINNDSGGQIITTDPVADGDRIFIIRDTARTQLLNITEGGAFPTDDVMTALDKLIMIAQEQDYLIRQTLHFSDVSTFNDIDVPDPEDGFLLGWIGEVLSNVDVEGERFIGDTESVTQDEDHFDVTFDEELEDANYEVVSVSFNWLSGGWYYASKTTTGFRINFANPAPASAELVWRVKV